MIMSLFKQKKKIQYSPKKWFIRKDCLKIILECAKSEFPNEFGGLLRIDMESKNTIIEVILLPGTISGNSQALFKLHMLPIDFSIVGTVHSHPRGRAIPSEADLSLFNKYGKIHIIIASPFNEYSWKSYDYLGKEINIEILKDS
jgi:proteasome lid subunit RPN8/RPN11